MKQSIVPQNNTVKTEKESTSFQRVMVLSMVFLFFLVTRTRISYLSCYEVKHEREHIFRKDVSYFNSS